MHPAESGVDGGRWTVVLSPPPTPNGPLHLGHLAGPYVAADIAARVLRDRGARVLSVCGLDDHQNYVLAQARHEGVPVRQLRDRYADLIRGVFAGVRVCHEEFTVPLDDSEYRGAVAGFLAALVDSGAVSIREWTSPACADCSGHLHHAYVSGGCAHCGAGSAGGTCEKCGSGTSAATLTEPTCTRCGRPATTTATYTGPVLDLAAYRPWLLEFWCQATIPATVRTMISALLAKPLPVIPLSYPTDWGIECPLVPGNRIDVWAEMALGYLYTVGQRLTPGVAGLPAHVAAWRSVGGLWTFLGLDNAFYYAVLFPAIYAAAGIAPDLPAGLVVNEFYRLSGAKFSTSRNHAVWAHEILRAEAPEDIRMFLSWDRPAPSPTNFTPESYRAAMVAWRETTTPAGQELAAAELARAESALALRHFDLALATRCLLNADPAERARLLAAISGRVAVGSGAAHPGRD
ncbi:hypothetical protein GCM10022222_83790 [Amycolatopsis ultiminotia]|uniref:Methionyl-tRNA synthetase n=1 Tax=Amycolatopsis ultiminotia TaxID=543629 RepID=A0ABP6YMM3_9PSEU